MSQLGLGGLGPDDGDELYDRDDRDDWDEAYDERRRRRGRRLRGCLPVLLVLVLIGGGLFFGGSYLYRQLSSAFASAPDYPGPGAGQITFQVRSGETSSQIGQHLLALGVVKSTGAFTKAAAGNSKSLNIQVGFYELKKQMKASDALAVLVDPANLVQAVVTVTEGARVRQIVNLITTKTKLQRADVVAALKNPGLGLPPEAKGDPEGYLYPATYEVAPDQTALGLLKEMVAKTVQVEQQTGLRDAAARIGYTPQQILTVASILEYEGNRSVDYPKIARVIYNRLDRGMPLQLDSTVSYVSGRSGDVWTTNAERANTSAYNTYAHTGLPPGPIGSPGQQTIQAALNPATGPWLYFVPDYEHHTTHFSTTLAEHEKYVAQLKAYCQTHSGC